MRFAFVIITEDTQSNRSCVWFN